MGVIMFEVQKFLFFDGRYSGEPILLNQSSNDLIGDITFIGLSLIGFALLRMAQKWVIATFF